MPEEPIAHQSTLTEQALPVGTVLSGDQFTVTGQLGAGGFGITYRAQDNVLGREIVIKECFPEDFCVRAGANVVARNKAHAKPFRSIVNMFMREARSLAKLRHPNIVGVHRAFEENETAYMAIDLIDGRDLFDLLDEHAALLSPARVKDILVQLLDAIEKVHQAGLLHRDISPDNIIIEKTGTPVLIDFGAARADASRHTRAVSSLLVVKDGYSPQEFYVAGSDQSPCSDLYALGATFYHVISGKPPPNSQTRMMEIAGKRPDPCVPLSGRVKGYEKEFLEAIDLAMQIHPKDRLQSAAKWKRMIAEAEVDEDAARVSKPRSAPNELSLELELSLSRLVEETNHEVRKTKAEVIEQEPASKEPAREVSKPSWVDEFNRDTVDPLPEAASTSSPTEEWIAAFQEASNGERTRSQAIEAHKSKRTHSETNWVDRAMEKQERIRSDRQAQFEAQFGTGEPRVRSTVSQNSVEDAPSELIDGPVPPDLSQVVKHRPLKIAIGLVIGFCSALLFTG
ncbi:MAG: serine/threonine-protein kinase [Pseudomonadota bacterium]